MANKRRDDFSPNTIDIMAKRVTYICSNPDCGKMTIGPNSNKNKATNIGVAAHIKAAAPGGKRYDPDMTSDERSDISNGIWLCQSCSKLIDTDDDKYTVELLQSWKDLAEKKSEKGISSEGKVTFNVFEIAVEDELSGELEINVDSESTVLTRKMRAGEFDNLSIINAKSAKIHALKLIKTLKTTATGRAFLNQIYEEIKTVIALLNESIGSDVESSHLGFLLLDSPKDKDLDNYRFDKYLQTIDSECCGQIIVTGSLSDEELYKNNLKQAKYFEPLRTNSKLLKKQEIAGT